MFKFTYNESNVEISTLDCTFWSLGFNVTILGVAREQELTNNNVQWNVSGALKIWEYGIQANTSTMVKLSCFRKNEGEMYY